MPNGSRGSSFIAVTSTCSRPAWRSPTTFTRVQIHNATSAQDAARTGVAVKAGNMAPTLPANATAIAAMPDQIEI